LTIAVTPPALNASAALYAAGVKVARAQIYPTAEILNTIAIAIGWEKVGVTVIAIVVASGVPVAVGIIKIQARSRVIAVPVASGVPVAVGIIEIQAPSRVIAVPVTSGVPVAVGIIEIETAVGIVAIVCC
jgi:hypothetical protein